MEKMSKKWKKKKISSKRLNVKKCVREIIDKSVLTFIEIKCFNKYIDYIIY